MKASRREQLRPKQFHKFLSLSENKILNGKELYVTLEDKAYCISSTSNVLSNLPLTTLSSQKEEADTKMFRCAQFEFHRGFERVNIITIDTDVAIIAIYFQSILDGKIYLEFGTSTRMQLFDISSQLTTKYKKLYLEYTPSPQAVIRQAVLRVNVKLKFSRLFNQMIIS